MGSPCGKDDFEVVRRGRYCHHVYHQECIQQWLSKHHSCPYCRQRILMEATTYERREESLNEVVVGVLEYLKLSIYLSGAT